MEEVGRKYEIVSYGLLTRRVGGDGNWYGRDNYRTLKETKDHFNESLKRSSRYQNVGGITVDFGSTDRGLYERKLVKVVRHCEVLDVGVGPP